MNYRQPVTRHSDADDSHESTTAPLFLVPQEPVFGIVQITKLDNFNPVFLIT